jgi:hypothetical protein
MGPYGTKERALRFKWSIDFAAQLSREDRSASVGSPCHGNHTHSADIHRARSMECRIAKNRPIASTVSATMNPVNHPYSQAR